ncbi:macro domain-containing protein [Sphaerochaeta halotolerans]|jgi:O-acetyl-ADP-ribose deacetylase (regulator of RNase III)/transcriptional regulator with XRE-family HTH domain|uniref:macro domain-containing protein n=1 Tax=Sphaerochaeta halotolerans TaxID=2293840 RepID=UPI001368096A|nr:macro domain-containing protein [Sphaerochaeta halotolerans]MXI86094.1 RNase III inhibitor [Sphaerochaeta halotolerans]
MPFFLVQNDITKMQSEAIVNAANTALLMGGGVCGAIFRAAGIQEMTRACAPLSPIKTGEAVITPGFSLPARYVIHTAGPVYHDGKSGERELLQQCYSNSLQLAVQHKISSLSFPLISSGIFGYPKQEALEVARTTIEQFLAKHELTVYLVLFNKESFLAGTKLHTSIEQYIEEQYVQKHALKRDLLDIKAMELESVEEIRSPFYEPNLAEALSNLDEPFSDSLRALIQAKGKTEVDVYKKANIDRKLFSKIRSGNGYTPSKRTVLALAIALELSLEETEKLLRKAGYALSHNNIFDIIIEYCIVHKHYKVLEVNEVLFSYDQPLLGSC